LQSAGVPVFTGATTTTFKGSGLMFRTRANDTYQMNALAQVMTGDLKSKKIAIYQGTVDGSSAVTELVNALNRVGVAGVQPVIQQPNGKTADAVKLLMSSQPDMIVAFGTTAEVADVYRTLRANDYTGNFTTTHADDTTLIQGLPVELRAGIYGVTTWAYSWQDPDSQTFTRDYVDLFGAIPQPLSAASYDAAVATYFAIKKGGIAPDALSSSLLKLGKTNSLQGTFNPTLGNNDLAATVSVILTNDYGAPTVLARFDETGRLKLIDTTPTFTPAPPTATPNGVVATAKGTLNVRSGPGENYPVIGQLRKGEQYQVIGASQDLRWLVINYRAANGWIIATGVDIFGNLNTVPIVPAPPTPTPMPATFTPTPTPVADIILVSATLSPAIPAPGQAFTLSATIRNNGLADAPAFAVATTFQPGNVYSSQNLPGLGAGQQTTVNLNGAISDCAIQTVAIVLDLNSQVPETPEGRANDKPPFSYKIDHSYMAQGHQNITSPGSADFDGGGADVSWNGTSLSPSGPAQIGVLGGTTDVNSVTWCMLTSGTVSGSSINKSSMPPGTLIAMYTSSGKRGVLKVTGYSGSTLQADYYVYNP
jgi:hypothetical protein